MKKILFIHHATSWGGAPLNMINIINSLDKTTFQVEVLLLRDSIVSEKLREYNIRYRIASSWFYRNFYKYYDHTIPGFIQWYRIKSQFVCWLSWVLSHYIFAEQELQNLDYDIVQLNSSVLSDWLKPCSKKGITIIHIQEPFADTYFGIRHRFFTNQMNKYADHIIAISNDNAKRINIPFKTTVVYNYSNIKHLNELDIEKYKCKSVLYVGGSASIKGFYTLVEALQFINDDITVYFAGYYSQVLSDNKTNIKLRIKRALKKIFYKTEIKQYCKFEKSTKTLRIGLLSDINDYLDISTCLVSPFSVPHFSRPIIEAFGRRKPAIASIIAGMDEIIDNGTNGILVPEGNAKSLAAAINYLCLNPEIAKKMGDNGYELAKNKYSQKNIELIHQIYRNLLKKKKCSKSIKNNSISKCI